MLFIGNLKEFFSKDAAEYQRHLARQYGPVTKLNGFLGVRMIY